MLDKRTTEMLEVANQLSEKDLDFLRSTACVVAEAGEDASVTEESADVPTTAEDESSDVSSTDPRSGLSTFDPSRGERERQRTRESKIATECIGYERAKHDWWPVGTQLQGKIMGEVFTALVVENSQVKSGRSLLITSGPANGKVCITPTRAALEATEAYRQANNLGRGGGVTDGWDFWKPLAS
jgi:hypothetical protein